MRVLLTGSCGFVGKNLTSLLSQRGYTVVGLDYADGAEVQYRLGSYQKDIAQILVDQDIKKVIHLASQSHVDRSIEGPREFIIDNVLGTLELFEACKIAKTEQIIHFSTDEVGACLEEGSFYEHFRFDCGSVYSASKGAQELLVQAYIKTFELPIVITRCVNIFGPHQHEEKLIPLVCKRAIKGDQIPIYGSGMQQRQWVSVEHVCEFVNFVLEASFIPPKSVLHITGTKEIYNINLVHTILSLLGASASLVSHVEDRLGHDERYSLGSSQKTLDFGCPEYDDKNFMEDLKKTVEFYREKFK